MTIVATKMMVKALRRKPLAFSHMSIKTLRGEGIR